MKTKQIWANLSVKDVEQTRAFYKALGFKINGPHNTKELASFLVGEDDFVVHFFAEEILKSPTRGMNGEIADLKQGNEVIFTLSAESKEEVDEWAKEVEKAGGTVFIEPQTIMVKYYNCGFADLDGHKWNVFYNGE